MSNVSVGMVHSGKKRLFLEAVAHALNSESVSVTWLCEEDQLLAAAGLPEEADGCDIVLVLSSCRPEIIRRVIADCRCRTDPKQTGILAMEADEAMLALAREAGATAYLCTDISIEAFRDCVQLIAHGVEIFPAGGVRSDPVPADSPICDAGSPPGGEASLSGRELEVVAALGQGLSNKNIARRLNITESTVKTHLKAILRKTGADNRTQVAIWAIENGIAALNGAESP